MVINKKKTQKSSRVIDKSVAEGNANPFIQETIARTYFKIADTGVKKLPIKLPWVIAVVSLAACLFVLIFNVKLDIRVRVLSEIPTTRVDRDAGPVETARDKGVFMVRGSDINKELIRDAYFTGDAKSFSRMNKEEVVLCNSKGNGWANYTVELREPVDLNKLDIKYVAKGARGDEKLLIVLVDSENRTYRMEKGLTPQLTKDWQKLSVNFRPVKNVIDLSNIVTIKFEFGGLTAGNDPVTTILLRDIYLSKTKKVIWI